MPLPRFIEIDGRRYSWRDLVALRRAQAPPRLEQPALSELHEDHRPPGERSAAARYREPSLFTVPGRRRQAVNPASAGAPHLRPAKGRRRWTLSRILKLRKKRKREKGKTGIIEFSPRPLPRQWNPAA